MNDDTLDLSHIEETLPQDVKQKNSKPKRGCTFEHILQEFDKIDENETVVAAKKPNKSKKSQIVMLPKAGFEESNQDHEHQPNNQGEEEVYNKPKRKTKIVSKTPRHQAPDHFPDPSFEKNAGHESLYQKRRENPESKLTFSSKVKQREEEEAEDFDSASKNYKMAQKKSLLQLNVRSNSNHEEYKAPPHNSLLPHISHTPRLQGLDSDNNRNMVYSPKVLTESGHYPEDYMEKPRVKNNKSSTVRLQLPALSQDSTPRRLIALETPKKSKISNTYFGVEQEDQTQVRKPLILFTESSLKKTEEDLYSFEKYSTPQNKRSLLLGQGFPSAFSNMGSDFVLKTQIERNRKDAEQLSLNSPQSARGVNWAVPGGGSPVLTNDQRNHQRQIRKVEDGVSLFRKIAVSGLVKPNYHGS